jgi:hypothetical protein
MERSGRGNDQRSLDEHSLTCRRVGSTPRLRLRVDPPPCTFHPICVLVDDDSLHLKAVKTFHHDLCLPIQRTEERPAPGHLACVGIDAVVSSAPNHAVCTARLVALESPGDVLRHRPARVAQPPRSVQEDSVRTVMVLQPGCLDLEATFDAGAVLAKRASPCAVLCTCTVRVPIQHMLGSRLRRAALTLRCSLAIRHS